MEPLKYKTPKAVKKAPPLQVIEDPEVVNRKMLREIDEYRKERAKKKHEAKMQFHMKTIK